VNRTANDIAAEELAQLRRENAELRQGSRRIAMPKDGETITPRQLAACRHSQQVGFFETEYPGKLFQFHTTDETGRRVKHFFGDVSEVWAPFKQPLRRLTGIGRK